MSLRAKNDSLKAEVLSLKEVNEALRVENEFLKARLSGVLGEGMTSYS